MPTNKKIQEYDLNNNNKIVVKFITYIVENSGKKINFKEAGVFTNEDEKTLKFWYNNLKDAGFFSPDNSVKLNLDFLEETEAEKNKYIKLKNEIKAASLVAEGKLNGVFKGKKQYSLINKETDSVIYNGSWFKIMQDKKTKAFYFAKPNSVVILPFFDENTILLETQYRPAIKKYLYEIPAISFPKYDFEETNEKINNLFTKETGYKAKSLTPIFSSYSSPGIYSTKYYFFIANELTKVKEPKRGIKITKLKMESAVNYVFNGDIQDNKTSLAILYYTVIKNHLKEQNNNKTTDSE